MQKVPEIVKEFSSHKVVVKYGDDYLFISTAYQDNGDPTSQLIETLAFECDEDGKVKSWHEVAGGPYMTIADVLTEISRFGFQKRI